MGIRTQADTVASHLDIPTQDICARHEDFSRFAQALGVYFQDDTPFDAVS
jgi:hypothetical protein